MDMDWVHVTAGDRFTCALRTGDTLWCAGDNTRFQLGSARTADATCLPGGGCTTFAEVPGVTFRDAQAGADHVCGIRTDGALLCWGDNGDNETGTGSAAGSIDVPTPVGIEMDWLMVAPGGGHSCGLRAGGLLFCWGDNVLGQVGQGTAVPNYATPIQVCIPR